MNTSSEMAPSQSEYDAFCDFLRRSCGIVLSQDKQYLVNSRLSRLARERGYPSISQLLRELNTDRALAHAAIEAMTTNETSWFRDRTPFVNLQDHILPELFSKRDRLRIWSAACSTGQEPYSISMTIDETQRLQRMATAPTVDILATDVAQKVLNEAEIGRFDALSTARGLTDDMRARYFKREGEQWQLQAHIRNRVTFRQFNLLNSFAVLGPFDLIFCRNVLIYFAPEVKEDVLRRLAQALNPGGYLILGASETANRITDLLELVRLPQGLVYRRR
ncbi:MAG: protein-glutamate O-methyltransferase CheR [Gammaproteobacteria bacterium]